MATAKFDIKTEAIRLRDAGVGVTDLAVGTVRSYVVDVQKAVTDFDFQPKALREQAVTVVSTRVDALTKEAKARREAIEARVAELQAEALKLPTTVQTRVRDNVATVTGVYSDLVERGEVLVTRIRRQESTKATVKSAKTTSTKAKTTGTQAKKTGAQTRTTAKKATKKATTTAKKSPAKGSAKATATTAKSTAANATKATVDAAQKVGD